MMCSYQHSYVKNMRAHNYFTLAFIVYNYFVVKKSCIFLLSMLVARYETNENEILKYHREKRKLN